MSLGSWVSFLGVLLVADDSTWEDPLLSQKRHLWNVSVKIRSVKNRWAENEGWGGDFTITLPGLYIGWEMDKNVLKIRLLSYNIILQLEIFTVAI